MSALAKVTHVVGRAVVVPGNDIDTDRIIPARFLKCVTFDALGPQLFYDERFDATGASKGHPLDAPSAGGATILVSGDNFGCGSSREHAPQSIHKAGFRGIVAGSFAEIFFGNSTTLGMPCMTLAPDDLAELHATLASSPDLEVALNVTDSTVTAGSRTFRAGLPEGVRTALVEGRWDPLGDLLEAADAVTRRAHDLGYLSAGHGGA